jgi:hypothetical protein
MVYIYILKLKNNKYYVGKTSNPNFRLESHFNSNGSAWTKKYKPINIHQLIPNCDNFDEDKITIKNMKKYGIDNVRGGSFCQLKLTNENKKTIERMINGSTDKCYKCGKKGHFANQCSSNNNKIKNNYKTVNNYSDEYYSDNSDEYYSDNYSDEYYSDNSDEYYSDDKYDYWSCDYCGKEFDTKKGALFHENVYCKMKKKTSYKTQKNNYTSSKTSNGSKCYKCGRNGHYSSNCYAKKHLKGYYL